MLESGGRRKAGELDGVSNKQANAWESRDQSDWSGQGGKKDKERREGKEKGQRNALEERVTAVENKETCQFSNMGGIAWGTCYGAGARRKWFPKSEFYSMEYRGKLSC